jgi:hypothetical protein
LSRADPSELAARRDQNGNLVRRPWVAPGFRGVSLPVFPGEPWRHAQGQAPGAFRLAATSPIFARTDVIAGSVARCGPQPLDERRKLQRVIAGHHRPAPPQARPRRCHPNNPQRRLPDRRRHVTNGSTPVKLSSAADPRRPGVLDGAFVIPDRFAGGVPTRSGRERAGRCLRCANAVLTAGS